MTEFVIDINQLGTCASQISALRHELDAVAVKLGAMQLGSVLQIRASTALIGRVADCKWAVANQSGDLRNLANGLNDIAELYGACEKNLTDPKTQEQAEQNNTQDPEYNFWQEWKDIFADLLGVAGEEAGPFLILAGLFDIFGGTGEDISDGAKNILSGISHFLNSGLEFVAGGEIQVKWMDMFGLTETGIADWSAAADDFWNKNLLNSSSSVTENAAVVCKWASYALSFIASGFQNYDEFEGDMSNLRFWGETAIQGAVDIGLGALAGVVAAALLPATWPAIAVGAIGAGVVWVANEVCEWITGENIGEHVADFLCDGVEWISSVGQDVCESISDGVETAWNGVCDWVDSWW